MSIRKTKAKAFFKHFLIDTIQVIMALGFVIVYSEAIDLSSIGYAFALWVLSLIHI